MNMMHMGGPMNGGGGPPPPQMLQMHHPMPHHHHVAVFASSAQAPPPQATPTPPVASSMNRSQRFFENRHIPGAMCAKKRCNNAQSIECAPPVMAQSEFIVQRAPKRSYELITPVQQQAPPPQMHFDVKRVQYMTGPPPQQQQQQQIQMQQQMQIQQNPQVQVQQQQRPNSNSSHSQGPSPPRNGIVSQQQTPPQQNGVPQQPNGVHQIKTDVENLEQHHQQQQQQQQQQRMMFQPQPYPDMNGHARMMAPPPPPPVSAPAPMPLPQSQMTHMPQHGLDIPYLIPTFGQNPGSDPFYPSKFELDFEHNGDPFVPPSYAQDMKGQVVLQQL
ncbi:Protein CBG23011 [Caenorhabditis briggsae]|uniref:Protein CBG23011 n=1 Tax=Caenorhabditis briggsae TaxID=6238 RepID=A8Y3G2_CAEBR|nr:Protein CBG23011 [Caenorhabditis briggsae]CAP39431.1 Protein CBG23011 [Caenorhabditis briggsae]